MKLSSHIPNVKNDLRWIVLLVIVFLLIIMAWPDPASGAAFLQDAALTPAATLTATPIPEEFLSTADQTSGIIFGSAVLVLIIVGGTVSVLTRKNGGTNRK